jgi:hypothetical protein
VSRTLRAVGIALLLSLLFGLVVGTLLRLRMERPVTYIGWRSRGGGEREVALVAPLDLG